MRYVYLVTGMTGSKDILIFLIFSYLSPLDLKPSTYCLGKLMIISIKTANYTITSCKAMAVFSHKPILYLPQCGRCLINYNMWIILFVVERGIQKPYKLLYIFTFVCVYVEMYIIYFV